MRIYSWNVNSVRARHDRLIAWLGKHQPDVLCLQELKTVDEGFPFEAVREAGYHTVMHGQKTYNGVAILAKSAPTDVVRNMDDEAVDEQARLIAATVDGVRVVCVYVPNGSEVGSEKWIYKRAWYKRLGTWLNTYEDPTSKLVLCGDFNVAPDDRDVAMVAQWKDGVLCSPIIRDSLQRIVDWGLVDTYRIHHQESGVYSWWDYRRLGFPKGNGLRIDMVYATKSLAERCTEVFVDREERKGSKPSDHCPVGAKFNLA